MGKKAFPGNGEKLLSGKKMRVTGYKNPLAIGIQPAGGARICLRV